MKVLGIHDNSGPKYHRILLPLALMGIDYKIDSDLTEENADVDMVFFNRVFTRQSIADVERLKEKFGFKLIVDFDDHWRLGPDHFLHETYKQTRASEVMEEYLRISDAVFVTHDRLLNEAKNFNDNVHILPNAITNFAQFSYKKIEDEKIRLFWSGSVTHKKDIQLLKGPVQRINRPGIKWVMGGHSKNPEWKAMASWFTNGGNFENELIESLPVESYYACYSKCDVALIPLVDNRFNSFKSNLKILEAANVSAPVIVSKVHPYLGFEGVVDYVEKQSDWFKHADYLLKNPSMIKEKGEKLKEYCKTNFDFFKINEERKQIFEHVTGK